MSTGLAVAAVPLGHDDVSASSLAARKRPSLDAVHTLVEAMTNPGRRAAIMRAAKEQGLESNALGFLASILEWETVKDSTKRKLLGSKLVSQYVEKGSPYEVAFLPADLRTTLCKRNKTGKPSFFADTKQILLEKITTSQGLREILSKS